MTRNYSEEYTDRIRFIREALRRSGRGGIVYGNSGGKDSALVGILCKAACKNTVGIIMPCEAKRGFETDMRDALEVANRYGIETRTADLSAQKALFRQTLGGITALTDAAVNNLAPRLRMITLYAVAASEGRLVAGTGNRSEAYMGYFTKWGDGAYDINPISDLTVTEIYEFLRYVGAPECVIEKAPSAGLFDGQTDEGEMGVSYTAIDAYLSGGDAAADDARIIEHLHAQSEHKRRGPAVYKPS